MLRDGYQTVGRGAPQDPGRGSGRRFSDFTGAPTIYSGNAMISSGRVHDAVLALLGAAAPTPGVSNSRSACKTSLHFGISTDADTGESCTSGPRKYRTRIRRFSSASNISSSPTIGNGREDKIAA